MYILAANETAINVLSLNAPGQAENIQSLDVSGPAQAAGLPLSELKLSSVSFVI
jgi:hypothetical protein